VQSNNNGLTATSVAAIATVAAAVFAAIFAFLNEWNKNRLRRKGIARVLTDDMRRDQSAVARARFRGAWWDDAEILADRVTDEDLQRLATSLKPGEWATVSSALGWMQTLTAARDRALAMNVPRAKVTIGRKTQPGHAVALEKHEQNWLEDTWYRLEGARWSLRRQAAPIPSRIPVRGWTRYRWRPHGQLGIQTDEVHRANCGQNKHRTPSAIREDKPLTKNENALRGIRYRGINDQKRWEERLKSDTVGGWERAKRWCAIRREF
jgi:hypothetical protein